MQSFYADEVISDFLRQEPGTYFGLAADADTTLTAPAGYGVDIYTTDPATSGVGITDTTLDILSPAVTITGSGVAGTIDLHADSGVDLSDTYGNIIRGYGGTTFVGPDNQLSLGPNLFTVNQTGLFSVTATSSPVQLTGESTGLYSSNGDLELGTTNGDLNLTSDTNIVATAAGILDLNALAGDVDITGNLAIDAATMDITAATTVSMDALTSLDIATTGGATTVSGYAGGTTSEIIAGDYYNGGIQLTAPSIDMACTGTINVGNNQTNQVNVGTATNTYIQIGSASSSVGFFGTYGPQPSIAASPTTAEIVTALSSLGLVGVI